MSTPGIEMHSRRSPGVPAALPTDVDGPASSNSATALLLGAASAAMRSGGLISASRALGRGLLRVTLLAASAAARVGASACHEACAREQPGDAEPCQEFLQFLSLHCAPLFRDKN